MFRTMCIASALAACFSAVPAAAQDGDTLSPLEMAVACAIPPQSAPVSSQLRLVGSQDTMARTIYAGQEALIVGAGSHDGVQVGMRYFVRRNGSRVETTYMRETNHAVHTAGWIRIVTVNEQSALAVIEHLCTDFSNGDYLEPYTAPTIPPGMDTVDTSGQLDFSSPAHVLYGDLERLTGAAGEFMLIDRGAAGGVTAGARFAIFRDLHSDHMPLASIGEAIVVAPGPDVSLVRIQTARDAVYAGDYLVPRK